jgi:hypothetical protein
MAHPAIASSMETRSMQTATAMQAATAMHAAV